MMCGMMDSGIHRALYVALCKDNEQYYAERIIFDSVHAAKLKEKRSSIIRASIPPTRISESEDAYACRWCNNLSVCKKGGVSLRTCRSCEHSEPRDRGVWSCELLNQELTQEDQLKACEHYSVIGS
jgi:hypothetical protein